MNVIRVHIDRKKLMSLPDDERILFLSLGLFVNEINALTSDVVLGGKSQIRQTK